MEDYIFIIKKHGEGFIVFIMYIMMYICKYTNILGCYIKDITYYILDIYQIDIHQLNYNLQKTCESLVIIIIFLFIIFIILLCVFIFIFISIFIYQIFTKVNKKIYKKISKIKDKTLYILCMYIFTITCILFFVNYICKIKYL